jgi:uncharacterized protein (DUF1015 family)
MPTLQAFRGIRYDLGHVGSLSDVVAPPYDVIGPDLQESLYKRHPANVIRLELNRDEPGDAIDAKYQRAARFLKNWIGEGVLQFEPDPALYVYHQRFDYAGRTHTRRGFMGRMRIEPLGAGTVFPHEETLAKAKEDRLKLTRACRANLSQIFGLYPDPTNVVQDLLEKHIAGTLGLECEDHLGVKHTMWPVSDVHLISQVQAAMGPHPLFIADGHHRYETACNYKAELEAKQGPLGAEHPVNYVLTMFVSMNDPGLLVLPTHRLLRGVPSYSQHELIEKLGDCFDCTPSLQGAKNARTVWDQIEAEGEQGTIGLFTAKDQQWTICRATGQAMAKMETIAAEHSGQWRGLGVSLLHRLVIEHLLGLRDMPKPGYVHLVDEVIDGLEGRGDEPDSFPLAALVMPATVAHVEQISRHKERMPAKSTYFYPKLLSGLVFHSLEK